jgi:hypothetical protein
MSVGNSSKQMQQTSGSSCSNLTDGDETAVDEVAVDLVAVDEVAVAVSVTSLLMVCGNCDRSNGLEGTVVWVCFTVRQG